MMSIDTVLCPVDLSPATTRQVDLTVDLCRAVGARLVLHHNALEPAVGSGVGWMWAADHQAALGRARRELQALAAGLPGDLRAEARLTQGGVTEAILTAADDADADLVIMSTHGTADGTHGSITARVLDRTTRSVFALYDAPDARRAPQFAGQTPDRQTLVAPTDLTPKSDAAVGLAFDLARQLGAELHLLHVLESDGGQSDETVRERLRALAPADLTVPPVVHVEHGEAARAIAHLADRLSAVCIVMGEHTATPLGHWFRPDTPHRVLRRAPCSVWYVPRQTVAA